MHVSMSIWCACDTDGTTKVPPKGMCVSPSASVENVCFHFKKVISPSVYVCTHACMYVDTTEHV